MRREETNMYLVCIEFHNNKPCEEFECNKYVFNPIGADGFLFLDTGNDLFKDRVYIDLKTIEKISIIDQFDDEDDEEPVKEEDEIGSNTMNKLSAWSS